MKYVFLALAVFYFIETIAQNTPKVLKVNQKYWSYKKKYFVMFQGDGNLVVYKKNGNTETPVWDSKTFGKGGVHCEMQGDGNLVIYDKESKPVWSSETYGYIGKSATVTLQDDGNLVVVACLKCYWTPLWSWVTGKWTEERIRNFPNTSGASKCCPGPAPDTQPSSTVYISQKPGMGNPCGCDSRLGGGQKIYLFNPTNKTYKVEVTTSNYQGTIIGRKQHTISPGQEIYLGCSVHAADCTPLNYNRKIIQ